MRAYRISARNDINCEEILVFAETAKVALTAARLRIRLGRDSGRTNWTVTRAHITFSESELPQLAERLNALVVC